MRGQVRRGGGQRAAGIARAEELTRAVDRADIHAPGGERCREEGSARLAVTHIAHLTLTRVIETHRGPVAGEAVVRALERGARLAVAGEPGRALALERIAPDAQGRGITGAAEEADGLDTA